MKLYYIFLFTTIIIQPYINLHLPKIKSSHVISYAMDDEDLIDTGWLHGGLAWNSGKCNPAISLYGFGFRYDKDGIVIDEDYNNKIHHKHTSGKKKSKK